MKKRVYLFWGFLDVIYLVWFCFGSIANGRIPYISDVGSAIEAVMSHGSIVVAGSVFLSFLLQLSIIASGLLLLLQHPKAKVICYFQIPLRLLYIVPSVSIILMFTSYVNNYHVGLVLGLVVISEIIKGGSLWKYG